MDDVTVDLSSFEPDVGNISIETSDALGTSITLTVGLGTQSDTASILSASVSRPGIVTTGTQSFSGQKTFQGDILPSGTRNLGSTSNI